MYVKSYMSKHKRSLMAQFVTGNLTFKIENGSRRRTHVTAGSVSSQQCTMYIYIVTLILYCRI